MAGFSSLTAIQFPGLARDTVGVNLQYHSKLLRSIQLLFALTLE